MHLYHLSVQSPGSVCQAVAGNFSERRVNEIVQVRGSVIELLQIDPDTGRSKSLCARNTFSTIRSIAPFRLTGGELDYVIVGSDSGKISVLKFNPETRDFEQVHNEMFGKTGCRRTVPGQYLATDPSGRAVMIAAVERAKFVYVLNRDSKTNLIISSPLEAHKSKTLVFSCVGLDVGFENPLFACLEVDYEDFDSYADVENAKMTKHLTIYELDLGLNHVTRKSSEEVDSTASMLIPIPSGTSGPGGVLICGEGKLTYRNLEKDVNVEVLIPKRKNETTQALVAASCMLKQKNTFFILIQTELGDLWKLTVNSDGSSMKIVYFDSIPVCSSLCMLKAGYLYCATELGNHFVMQFLNLDDEAGVSSVGTAGSIPGLATQVDFAPHKLQNLYPIDEIESFCPLIDQKAIDLFKEETPQFFTLCGRGESSSLRIIRHGVPISELAVSQLPCPPLSVFCLQTSLSSAYHQYIILSYSNATMILSIGETVEEVSDSSFKCDTQTIEVGILSGDTLVQIYDQGVRLISPDKQIQEWNPVGVSKIVKAAVNASQIFVALDTGEIIYLELENSSVISEVFRRSVGTEVTALCLSMIPDGRMRSKFLVVGSADNRIRVFKIDDVANPFNQISIQDVTNVPQSAVFFQTSSSLSLFIGLRNGMLFRSKLDETTGQLLDTKRQVLGSKPVNLGALVVLGQPAIIALSSRSYVFWEQRSLIKNAPLSYEYLESASIFNSEQCPDGLVAISESSLRIFSVDRFSFFNSSIYKLPRTPRKLVFLPSNGFLIISEYDHCCYPTEEKSKLAYEGMDISQDDEESISFVTGPRAKKGQWSGSLRIFDPFKGETSFILELEANEVPLSMTLVEFTENHGILYLAVGVAKDLKLQPRSGTYFVNLYKVVDDGTSLSFVHSTPVENCPLAMHPFQGRLLVGVGNILRIYDIGKKRLLRKSENRNIPNQVMWIQSRGDRIYVGDIHESFHFLKYRKAEKQIYLFADCKSPRHLTSCTVLDYNTLAGADKFGNVFVVRLPAEISEEAENDTVYGEWMNSANHKLQDVVNFHLGDIVTSLQKVAFVSGDPGVLMYATISGALGAFLPFNTREDVDFFFNLELQMRQKHPSLTGRDHLAYRSYYFPIKDCIDGDLCEQYITLPVQIQTEIASELGCEPQDILGKIEEIRTRFI